MTQDKRGDAGPLTIDEFSALAGMAPLARERAVAAAVSGGPDSMALCRLLAEWSARNKGPAIHALTVDHGLRPESATEAKQVARRVKGWPRVSHEILKLKGLRGKSRVMESARQGRYELMAEYCRRKGIGVLLTAHHLDDQAETFLYRLAAGSGPDGLAGMRENSRYGDLVLARPLLGVAKERLVATCRHFEIPFVEDPTNDNPRFTRSRLRQARDVLEREGLSAKRLAVTAKRMRRACDALEHYAAAAYDGALRERAGGRTVFDFAALADAPAEISLRVLLAAMKEDGYGPRRERLEELAGELFRGENFKKRTLGGYIIARDRKKGLIIVQKEGL